MQKRTAIILFNLGGPESLDEVKPFLFRLFSDPAIIKLPLLLRKLVAWLITWRREKKSREIYAKIGGKSPIREMTAAQAEKLQEKLGDGFRVFFSMRYSSPSALEVAKEIKELAPDKIILLPLYPQFSTATTASSLKNWQEAAKKTGLRAVTETVCCYPEEEGFIEAHADLIKQYYEAGAKKGKLRILFSAHGLPEETVQEGDPYQWQIELTVEKIITALAAKTPALKNLDHIVCYQSRVGPLEWIKPYTEDEIMRAAKDGVGVLIVPIAFVSEHSETLYELDIFYKEIAKNAGIQYFNRVPALSIQPGFISALAKVCLNENRQRNYFCDKICPAQYDGCLRANKSND